MNRIQADPGRRPSQEPIHPAYVEGNSAAHNKVLEQQFTDLLVHAQKSRLDVSNLLIYLKNQPYLKSCEVDVIVDTSRWPVAFQPLLNNIVINPHLLSLGRSSQDALIYVVTEIFDQVIYAQLHARADGFQLDWIPQDLLTRLIKIKAAKQDAINVALMGGIDQEDELAEPPIVIDPYSAWHLASPRHITESRALEAFQKAMQAGTR